MTPKEAYKKCLKENKKIPELESIIATDPYSSYRYARDVIKRYWEKGENLISSDPEWSYRYAFYIIKGSFEKCHPIIFNSKYKNEYMIFLESINYDMNKISEWLI